MHVFPGGVLDESDCSSAWLDVFAATRDCFSSLCMKTPLPLYNNMPPSAGTAQGAVLTSTLHTFSLRKKASLCTVSSDSIYSSSGINCSGNGHYLLGKAILDAVQPPPLLTN